MRDNRGRTVFVAHHSMGYNSQDIKSDIVKEASEHFRVNDRLEFDKSVWDVLTYKLLIPELQKELNGFQSEEHFSSKYWFKNIHDQISSTKRNLIENFYDDVKDYIKRFPSVSSSKTEFDGQNSYPETSVSSFQFQDIIENIIAEDEMVIDMHQVSKIIDSGEIKLHKYNNWDQHALPKNSIIELLAHLVWKNPGEQDIYYLNQIDFNHNQSTGTDHKKMLNGIIYGNRDYLNNKYFDIEVLSTGEKNIFVFRPKMKRAGYYVLDKDGQYKLKTLTELAEVLNMSKQNLKYKLSSGDIDQTLKTLLSNI